MASFILIHGTFARDATWTSSDSPLCKSLEDAVRQHGQPTTFTPVKWSGRNWGTDRVETAASIANEIKARQARAPGDAVFLIGHSHGGSAIAYLLKNFPDVRDGIAGCAFLSTPFVAQRIRPHWEELLTAIVAVAGMLIFFLAALGTAYLVAKLGWLDREEMKFRAVLALAACFIVGGGVTVWIWTAIGPHLRSSLAKSLLRRISEGETADIASAQHLFIRASGDEAAAALGANQFIAWSVGKLVGFASVVVLWLRRALLRVYSSWVGCVALILVAMLFAIWLGALFVVTFGMASTFEQFVRDLFIKPWTMDIPFGHVGTIIDWCTLVLWPAFVTVFLGALLYSLVTVIGLLTGMLTLRLFGWMSYQEAIFTDFSVEPVPYGQVSFVHIDWKDQGVDALGLSHSRTYLNPRALDCLSAWVSEILRKEKA